MLPSVAYIGSIATGGFVARIDFGHTWWGKRWLRALSNIDYENRLPRGARYARNGSVTSIEIDGTTVAALVQGRRSSPYRVHLELWRFTEDEQAQITDLVASSPYHLSQLEARRLPPELDEECASRGIRLFPDSWDELGMSCSCPDWAVPCKHLAAVVYLIANEIDKNPFLVFEMHGFDLLTATHGEHDRGEEEIAGIASFVATKDEAYNYYREHLERIDFSTVPDLYPAVSEVLTEFPLFYLKNDFKTILLDAYRRLSRATRRHVKNLELQEEPPRTLYTSCTISIRKTRNAFAGKLRRGSTAISFDSDDLSPLVTYLHLLSAGDLAVYPPLVSFLIMTHAFALTLLERRAAIPDIIAMKKGTYLVRWIPALFNPEIRSIFDTLVDALPREIVRYGTDTLEHREQVLFLISFFLRHYIRLFDPAKKVADEPIPALFFRGAEYKPSRFEERENAQTIHLWLGRFFTRPVHDYPVIKIDEREDDAFRFEIRVADRHAEEGFPESFDRFLTRSDERTLPLLRDLSLLATYLPTVNDFLRRSAPIVVAADEFVSSWFAALPALRTLGVHTIVPRALEAAFRPGLTLGIKATAGDDNRVVSYTSLSQMLEFDWRVAVGDQIVSAEELLELGEGYRGYLRFRDRYLELDEKEIEAIRRRLERDPTPSPMDLLRTALTGVFEGAPVAMDEHARTLFERLLEPPEVEVPANLQATLRPYQERAYRWLYHNHRIGLGSVVADDMGLGKTVQVIAFLLRLANESTLTSERPALVVVPASVVTNWQREIARFAPDLAAAVYHGADREIASDAQVVITTYALARRDAQTLRERRWSVTVLDEAQNIKNAASVQAKAAKSFRADYAIAMTGTPVENRLLDYWSIVDFVMRGYLGTKTAFKEQYAIPIERYRDRGALERFRKVTAPLIMRRLKTDRAIISDLPDKIVTNRFPPLTKEQTALYKELVDHSDEWLADTEGIDRAGAVFKLMTGLKQICCHPRLYTKKGSRSPTESGKAQTLLELLETIVSRGEKALVFTQYAQMGELLAEFSESTLGRPVLFLHGGSTRTQRDTMVDAFQNDPNHCVMVLSIKAGGVGLNLTAANHVIHYDLWWNPAVENQATDRAFRIGQRKDVTVYRLVTRGTFEERINEMLEAKQELADLTVAEGEQWLTRLSDRELRELVELGS
ncbi:MAG: SNF2-related protein [Spirochaetaceae bacterium]